MPKFTRREFLAGAAGAAASALLPASASAREEAPRPERRTLVLPGLDPRHDGLRVVQLSDLHVGPRTPPSRIRAAVDEANRFQPDLVALTGDYVSKARAEVAQIREQLGGLSAPTVAVLGNHDHWVDAEGTTASLRSLGYGVLRNQHTTLALRGAPFTVVGIDDLLTRHADPGRALAGASRGSRLVLAHGPKTADLLRQGGEPLLCLSGHTHGGQVSIPLITPLVLHGLMREPYTRGLFRLGEVQLYVNRGVGDSALGMRVNSPPEVTLLTLRSGAPS
jgi:predicted MPP superfamily phosphohydrolase